MRINEDTVQRSRLVALLVVALLVLAGCGGDSEPDGDSGDSGSASSDDGSSSSDNGGDSFTVSDDRGQVTAGNSLGEPDWLPAWVELPNGLEITTQFNSPGTGEAAVLGIVEGESQDELLAEALILLQSSGYAIGEQYESINGKGFEAEHLTDGSRVVFNTGEFIEGSSTWSMEFYSDTGGGDGDEQLRNEDPTSRYDTPGVMTVMVGGQTFDVIGSCEFGDGYGVFQADDARSVFDVFQGGESGGLGAVGGASIVVDGEVVRRWHTDDSVIAIEELELTADSMFYVGGMREDLFDAEPEPGTIEINCG